MLDSLLKYWPFLVGFFSFAVGDCTLRLKAMAYLKSCINEKVDKAEYNVKIKEISEEQRDIILKVEKISERLYTISAQNEFILSKIEYQKEASDRADAHLREIISLLPKKKSSRG